MAAGLRAQPVGRIGLRTVELLAGQRAVAARIGAADVARDLAVGDAVHLQVVQAAEVADLLERQRGVVDEPHGGGLGVEDVGHRQGSFRCGRSLEARPP